MTTSRESVAAAIITCNGPSHVQRDSAATWAGTLLAPRGDPHVVTGYLNGGCAEAGESRNRVAPEVAPAVARDRQRDGAATTGRAPADEVGALLSDDRPRAGVRVDRERCLDAAVGIR